MKFSPSTFRAAFSGLVFLLFILKASDSNAQDKSGEVKGAVTNNNGEPIAGVSVVIRNTKNNFNAGTSTDSSGVFAFPRISSAGSYSFTFSAVGFETQHLSGYQIKDNRPLSLAVKLKDASVTLDQVVVVGYGTQKKSDVTGSVVRVTTDKTADLPNYNILQSLQGRVPGLNVTSPDRPGKILHYL